MRLVGYGNIGAPAADLTAPSNLCPDGQGRHPAGQAVGWHPVNIYITVHIGGTLRRVIKIKL